MANRLGRTTSTLVWIGRDSLGGERMLEELGCDVEKVNRVGDHEWEIVFSVSCANCGSTDVELHDDILTCAQCGWEKASDTGK